jgi:hypothetical protein
VGGPGNPARGVEMAEEWVTAGDREGMLQGEGDDMPGHGDVVPGEGDDMPGHGDEWGGGPRPSRVIPLAPGAGRRGAAPVNWRTQPADGGSCGAVRVVHGQTPAL